MLWVARQRLHEALRATSQVQHHVQGDLLLENVIRQGSPVFKLSPRRLVTGGWLNRFLCLGSWQ